MNTLRPINFENGLRCIDLNLQDTIISFVDRSHPMALMNIFVFLKDLNLPFEINTDAVINHFKKYLSEGGWYYRIRDYILSESRKTTEYLRQRLLYLSDTYDINISFDFENGCNKYAIQCSFLHCNKTIMLKSYSDIMDCLDVLEVNIEEYLTERKKLEVKAAEEKKKLDAVVKERAKLTDTIINWITKKELSHYNTVSKKVRNTCIDENDNWYFYDYCNEKKEIPSQMENDYVYLGFYVINSLLGKPLEKLETPIHCWVNKNIQGYTTDSGPLYVQ